MVGRFTNTTCVFKLLVSVSKYKIQHNGSSSRTLPLGILSLNNSWRRVIFRHSFLHLVSFPVSVRSCTTFKSTSERNRTKCPSPKISRLVRRLNRGKLRFPIGNSIREESVIDILPVSEGVNYGQETSSLSPTVIVGFQCIDTLSPRTHSR